MSAPFFKYGLFGDEASLIVAFVTGIAFGFCLERAGFGNARILAAQFYLRDLRVLKVMFTAIVTAMVGLFFLARFGLVDLSLVYLTPTFVLPQVVGGLILGAGFIIGGYCPGTSCVSAATGRLDGMFYLGGIILGLVGFAELYPAIADLAHATPLGQVTLPQLFQIPYGIVVAAVVFMALGAFVAGEWAERRFGGKEPDAGALLAPTARMTPTRWLAVALAGGGVVAAFSGDPYRGPIARVDTRELALSAGTKADHVSCAELADWIIEGRNDYVLVDVREPAEFAQYHIPGAINVPLAALTADFAARNERIVFYSEGGIHAAQAWLLLRSLGFRSAYLLFGGLEEWKDAVLYPVAPAADAPAKVQVEFAKRAAVAKHLGGTPRAATPAGAPAPVPAGTPLPAPAPVIVPPAPPPPADSGAPAPAPAKKRKKEGC